MSGRRTCEVLLRPVVLRALISWVFWGAWKALASQLPRSIPPPVRLPLHQAYGSLIKASQRVVGEPMKKPPLKGERAILLLGKLVFRQAAPTGFGKSCLQWLSQYLDPKSV